MTVEGQKRDGVAEGQKSDMVEGPVVAEKETCSQKKRRPKADVTGAEGSGCEGTWRAQDEGRKWT